MLVAAVMLCYVSLSKWCNCGRGAIAVSVAACYAKPLYISAHGAIVEDEQLQCPLQAVMLCSSMSQQVVQLWKMSNCSANNISPFPLAGNVTVQGSMGSRYHSSLHYPFLICLL